MPYSIELPIQSELTSKPWLEILMYFALVFILRVQNGPELKL